MGLLYLDLSQRENLVRHYRLECLKAVALAELILLMGLTAQIQTMVVLLRRGKLLTKPYKLCQQRVPSSRLSLVPIILLALIMRYIIQELATLTTL